MHMLLCCDLQIREEIVRYFDDASVNIIHFNHHMELSDYLSGGHPVNLAIVILDGNSGMNTCVDIRETYPEVPILWFSDQEELEEAAKRIPVTEFMAKPYHQKWIFNIIHYYLQK